MKRPTTRYEKIKQKISTLEQQQWELRREKEQKQAELDRYCARHRSLCFDALKTQDTKKLWEIYRYFDKRYPIYFQGGLRCDGRGMRLSFWVMDDPNYICFHITSTSENICFSGSTTWMVKAPTMADKINIIKTTKQDILKIIKQKD